MNNKENDKWGGLSLRDKAALMKVYVSSGTSSISQMREHYNTYKHGGPLGNMFDGYGNSTNQVFTNINNSRNTAKPLSNQIARLNVSGINTPQQVNQQTQIQQMQSPGIQAAMQQRQNQPDQLGATKEGTFSTGTDERTSAQRNTDYFHPLKGAAERNKSRYQAGNSVWNGLETMANVGAEGIVNMVGGKAATGLAQGTRMAKPVIGKTLGAASEVTGITPAYMMGNNTKVNQDMGRAQDYLVGQVKSGVSNTFNKATTGVGNMFNSAKAAMGFAEGGYVNTFGKGGREDVEDVGKTGMMKARIAYADAFENKTGTRLTGRDTREYTFTQEDINKINAQYPNSEIQSGSQGNVFIGSYDNYITPSIQDVNGELKYIDKPWGSTEEQNQRSLEQSIKFESPEDAEYFGNNYKKVAPMMTMWKNEHALGGPLYNEDNPIEGFQGNNYIPAVRYSLGGRVLKRRKSKK